MAIPALFLDRDGVINVDIGYLHHKEKLVWVQGIFELLYAFKQRGYLLVMITNQSGIHRGYFSFSLFCDVSVFIQDSLKERLGFALDRIYFCPHLPEEDCVCRKPKIGLLEEVLVDFPDVDVSNSVLVGDSWTDILAGRRMGVGQRFWLHATQNDHALQDHEYLVSALEDILPKLS